MFDDFGRSERDGVSFRGSSWVCHSYIYHERLVREGNVQVRAEPLGAINPRFNVNRTTNLTKELCQRSHDEIVPSGNGCAPLL